MLFRDLEHSFGLVRCNIQKNTPLWRIGSFQRLTFRFQFDITVTLQGSASMCVHSILNPTRSCSSLSRVESEVRSAFSPSRTIKDSYITCTNSADVTSDSLMLLASGLSVVVHTGGGDGKTSVQTPSSFASVCSHVCVHMFCICVCAMVAHR